MEKVLYFRNYNECAAAAVSLVITVSGCATGGPSHPLPRLQPGGIATQEQKTPPPIALLDSISEIESMFARSNCEGVQRSSQDIYENSSPQVVSALPLSTRLAMSVCASRLLAGDPEQGRNALSYLEAAERSLVPLWDPSEISLFRAKILESLGDRAGALEVRRNLIVRFQQKTQQTLEKNQLEILQLSEKYESLSEFEKSTLRRFASESFRQSGLSTAVEEMTAALSASSNPDYSEFLRELRDTAIFRLESEFAKQSLPLVQALSSANRNDVNELIAELERKFPSESFRKRIQALVGAYEKQTELPLFDEGEGTPKAGSLLTYDERIRRAKEELNRGRPDEAVELLRTIPEASRTGEAAHLLREAETVHIRELRLRVRDLFQTADTRPNASAKIRIYEQCLEVLNSILEQYPETSFRRSIERNIRNIESRISEINND